jgi:hypothetical protein
VDTLQEKKSESLKQRDTIQTNTHTLPPPSTDGQTSYEIIVATFARRSEAEDYVARSIKKGIVVKILDDAPGSRIRISYASFTNKDLAEMELTQIRKNISPDAWMAIINPKKL